MLGEKDSREIKELLRVKSLRVPLIVIPFAWFVVSLVGYGLTFSVGDLAGSIYVNGYINAGANVISYVLVEPMANGLGRKKSLILSMMISGVGILASFPFTSYGVVVSYVCMSLGTFGSTAALNIVYLIAT